MHGMDLEDLSASSLRQLLIEEAKKFIICLDHCSTEELQGMKYRLRKIFDLIAEKEEAEIKTLVWARNSSHTSKADPNADFIDKIIKKLQSD